MGEARQRKAVSWRYVYWNCGTDRDDCFARRSGGRAPADGSRAGHSGTVETLAKTSLGSLAPGAVVNLEMPTAAGAPLGGHIVQGHVDGTGELVSLAPVIAESDSQFSRETTDWTLRVRVPEHVRPWMVLKGSVALEGISLTIADVAMEKGESVISIAILPLTYWRTNLHTLQVGAPINVEADVLVKLAWARMEAERKPELELTEAWLVAEGF